MNDSGRKLIEQVCSGDIKKSQDQARAILVNLSSQKDERFKNDMLRKLDVNKKNMIELPYNLQEFLIAEDVSNFPKDRFLIRCCEQKVVTDILSVLKVAEKLSELGIRYSPSLMLYGQSGGGKTMLARYIAHVAGLPFLYVKFSGLVSSYLGSTQSNVAKMFDYARSAPCVLCFDEIDAVGMARGQKNDIGEMNRIVISLMQEMDRLPNNVIIIGTTNRYDRLDDAVIRRFSLHHEIEMLSKSDVELLSSKFFNYSGIEMDIQAQIWRETNLSGSETAASVVDKCTRYVIDKMIAGEGHDV